MGESKITIQRAFVKAANALGKESGLGQVFNALSGNSTLLGMDSKFIGAMKGLHRNLGEALAFDNQEDDPKDPLVIAKRLADFLRGRFKSATNLEDCRTKGFTADDSTPGGTISTLKKLFAHSDPLNADTPVKWDLRLVNLVGGLINRIVHDTHATKFLETLRNNANQLTIVGKEEKQESEVKFLNESLIPHYRYRCSYKDFKFTVNIVRAGTRSMPEFQIGINDIEHQNKPYKPFSVITPSLIKSCPGLIDAIIERFREINSKFELFTFVSV